MPTEKMIKSLKLRVCTIIATISGDTKAPPCPFFQKNSFHYPSSTPKKIRQEVTTHTLFSTTRLLKKMWQKRRNVRKVNFPLFCVVFFHFERTNVRKTRRKQHAAWLILYRQAYKRKKMRGKKRDGFRYIDRRRLSLVRAKKIICQESNFLSYHPSRHYHNKNACSRERQRKKNPGKKNNSDRKRKQRKDFNFRPHTLFLRKGPLDLALPQISSLISRKSRK